ncbi:hypothetical protein PR048_009828 [Dryococelus australis]|uniref:PiggyBac transposable element-derived protein domain-containing protein n=1 Tax=Dryococelus australis TaxID=614101 RepID=A0ABQ9I224_9NEOP|nr:hypothetical protein PR048_009828 [Dryococelus australis]
MHLGVIKDKIWFQKQSWEKRERNFWKKIEHFDPLPPAPAHEPETIQALNLPPQDYMRKYLPEDLFSIISDCTNRRYFKECGIELKCTLQEIKIFFTATVMMSYLGYPRVCMYWAGKTKVSGIAEKMNRDRYLTIRNKRQVPKMIWNDCQLNPKNKNISINEQMVPFCGLIKSKPNPCVMKIFVVAAPDGLPLDFFFIRRGDPIVEEDNLQCLGVGGKAVMRLTQNLPTGDFIYIGRFFTSMHLLDLLHLEAQCTGTVQRVRIPRNTKLMTDK